MATSVGNQHPRKITRRTFAIGAAGLLTGGYLFGRCFDLFNHAPEADFSYVVSDAMPNADLDFRTPIRTLKYIAPNSSEEILFYNTSTDPDNNPLTCALFLDAQRTSDTVRAFDGSEPPVVYSGKLSAGDHVVRLEVKERERIVTLVNRSSDPDAEWPTLIRQLLGMEAADSYTWFIDGKKVSTSYQCSERLSVGEHKAHFLVSDTRKESSQEQSVMVLNQSDSLERSIPVDPENVPQFPEWQSRIAVKGVTYHIGRHFLGDYGQPPTHEEMEESLAIIRNELGCNGIRIWGDYEDEMTWCARRAIEKGFTTILLCPRYSRSAPKTDSTIEQHIDRITEFSVKAEELSEKSGSIVLVIGDELTISVRGITTAPTYEERDKQMEGKWGDDYPYADELNNYLRTIVEGVRQHFNGKLTYASAMGERYAVDWRLLDIVAPHLYLLKDFGSDQMYRAVSRLKAYHKPIYATEFGAATFKGAYGPVDHTDEPYSQEDQAKCIQDTMKAYDRAGLDGMFLFAFMLKFAEDADSYGIMRYDRVQSCRRKLGFYAFRNCHPSHSKTES